MAQGVDLESMISKKVIEGENTQEQTHEKPQEVEKEASADSQTEPTNKACVIFLSLFILFILFIYPLPAILTKNRKQNQGLFQRKSDKLEK